MHTGGTFIAVDNYKIIDIIVFKDSNFDKIFKIFYDLISMFKVLIEKGYDGGMWI